MNNDVLNSGINPYSISKSDSLELDNLVKKANLDEITAIYVQNLVKSAYFKGKIEIFNEINKYTKNRDIQ